MRFAVENVRKSFPGVVALDGVSLDIRPGEVHALVGENGAGKSTLIKIITGLYRPDEGRLLVDGAEARFASPREAIAAGISAVHQERNLIPRFTVGENIMIERPPAHRGLIDFDAVHAQARRFLAMIDPSIDIRTEVWRPVGRLVQIVEIAKALSLEASVLLLDEPTASISGHEAEALFAVLRRLKGEGRAIVFVSHKLEEVGALSDRVTVLRDGKVAIAGEPIATMDRGRIVSAMIGREERVAEIGERRAFSGEPVLEAEAVATSLGHRDISFALHKGEILGLYGLVGAGRTELARALIGDAHITAGALRLNGRPIAIGSVTKAIRKFRMGYISEDRKGEGLVSSPFDSLECRDHRLAPHRFPPWPSVAGSRGRSRKAAGAPARDPDALARADCRQALRRQSAEGVDREMAGGRASRFSSSSEPTVGIDIRTKAAIHELIAEITRGGVSVLLISRATCRK